MLCRLYTRRFAIQDVTASVIRCRGSAAQHQQVGLRRPCCASQPWTLLYSLRNFYSTASIPKSEERDSETRAEERVEINIETDLDHSSPFLTTTPPSTFGAHQPAPFPPNQNHRDLTSFLTYAARTGLSKTSTTYRGTYYEYLTLLNLRRYGFDLVRVGGRGDKGCDLVGVWYLPSVVNENAGGKGEGGGGNGDGKERGGGIKVILQCKRLTGTSKLGPNLIRELEGSMRNGSAGWRIRDGDVMGVLVGTRPATKGVREAMAQSRRAVGWVYLDVHEERDADKAEGKDEGDSEAKKAEEQQQEHTGRVRQMLWNRAASDLGLVGVDAVARYSAGAGTEQEVVLMWKDKVIPGLGF